MLRVREEHGFAVTTAGTQGTQRFEESRSYLKSASVKIGVSFRPALAKASAAPS